MVALLQWAILQNPQSLPVVPFHPTGSEQTMDVDRLTASFPGLTFGPQEFVRFDPPGNIKASLCEIPRYLFRIFSRRSQGVTDRSWAKSMIAKSGAARSSVDIFQLDDYIAAAIVNRHLHWLEGPDDNLVSWTSSLLFALVYIFHLHANTSDQSTFDNIWLCVVDTAALPKDAFIRDTDLIRAYECFDEDLRDLGRLRSQYNGTHSGHFYFGEYLSQGSLCIENQCQIVSAQDIIDNRLYDVRREFEEFTRWGPCRRPPWAIPVLRLRDAIGPGLEAQEVRTSSLEAAIRIAGLFGPRWRMPVVINLIATIPNSVIWETF